MTLTWDAVNGAVEYNVYRAVNGIFAYVGTASNTSFTDEKIEPDLSATAPIAKNPFENENYPSVVNYFQQRKILKLFIHHKQELLRTLTFQDHLLQQML